MARDYRPNVRESSDISRLDSAKEAARVGAINQLYEVGEDLANRTAMKRVVVPRMRFTKRSPNCFVAPITLVGATALSVDT